MRHVFWISALLVAALLGGGCAKFSSVAHFGRATATFSNEFASGARDAYELCQLSQDLKTTLDLTTGRLQPGTKAFGDAFLKDPCASYRTTARLYGRLAGQLGAFGLALHTLAEEGDTDYTERLTSLSADVSKLVPALQGKQEQLKSASGLVNRILNWFTQGYSSGEIASVLRNSEADVTATLELLEAVIAVYQEQANLYGETIRQVATAPDFAAAGTTQDQLDLLKTHTPVLFARQELLTETAAALSAIKSVHAELVKEAKGADEQFELAALVAGAKALRGQIAEYKELVNGLRGKQ